MAFNLQNKERYVFSRASSNAGVHYTLQGNEDVSLHAPPREQNFLVSKLAR